MIQNENDLVSLIKEGDIKAFDEFYKRNWRKLYHIAYHSTNSSEDSKDLVQSVFVNFWNNRLSLDAERYHASYLTIALKNSLANFYRKNALHKKRLEELYDDALRRHALNNPTEDKLIAKETAKSLEQEIQGLPDKMQQVFVLSRQHYLSVNEISETLNITPRTVKNQISNALKILRVKMGIF
jgi:RNA polymerase sigma-70 factor (ECF subfamily)